MSVWGYLRAYFFNHVAMVNWKLKTKFKNEKQKWELKSKIKNEIQEWESKMGNEKQKWKTKMEWVG